MRLTARHYRTGKPVVLELADGRIVSLADAPQGDADERLPYIAGGLIDLQVNGYAGQEFSSPNLDVPKVAAVVAAMNPFGVTRFCPTVTTQSFDVIHHALKTIATACAESPELAHQICGIHLEGPCISREDGPRGAHPLEHCRAPDFEEFERLQEAAGGRIRILTLSPEYDTAPPFIRKVTEQGVIVSLGHTAATPDQIRAAADAGARMSTHLGNGCHAVLPRHRSYLWEQLADDRLTAGLIVDGHHLPPGLVKTFLRAKTPQRCVLVSDMAGQAGLPPGRYPGNLCDVEILADGRLVVAGQTEFMAGASFPLGDGVANVMRFASLSLAEAVALASEQPAQLLGLETPILEPGAPADLVLFDLDEEFRVRATIVGGQVVFGNVE